MLKALRKKTKLVIWTVIACFVLWGGFAAGIQFQKRGRIAGEVFGREVTFQEFDDFSRAARIFSPPGQPIQDPQALRLEAWQSLILSREAKRRKIEVADEEVREMILKLLAERKMENSAPHVYQTYIRETLQEPVQQFERQLREILRIRKLLQEVNGRPLEPESDSVSEETKQKEKENFLAWHQDLMVRSQLKDYMSEQEEPAAS